MVDAETSQPHKDDIDASLPSTVSPVHRLGRTRDLINDLHNIANEGASNTTSKSLEARIIESGNEGEGLIPVMVRCDAWPPGTFSPFAIPHTHSLMDT